MTRQAASPARPRAVSPARRSSRPQVSSISMAGLEPALGPAQPDPGDPLLARMTSADPTVTDPMNPQGWNRYSYVGNDPLAFTDPNGFSWFSNFWHGIEHAFSNAWHAVTHFIATHELFRAILQIGINAILSPFV